MKNILNGIGPTFTDSRVDVGSWGNRRSEKSEKPPCLSKLKNFMVDEAHYNPIDFFQKQSGLWVSEEFTNLVLVDASNKVVCAKRTEIGYTDLLQKANDLEIQQELPKGYVFESADLLLCLLASLINGQWGGMDGVLRNNGLVANICHFRTKAGKIIAIRVGWHSGTAEWYCRAHSWSLDKSRVDHRFLSAVAPKV